MLKFKTVVTFRLLIGSKWTIPNLLSDVWGKIYLTNVLNFKNRDNF